MATYDPVSTATALAESYVYARQATVDTGTSNANAKVSALTSLKSSMTTFTAALNTLSAKDSVVQQTASVSNTTAATASVSAKAAAGQYTFEVTQLATAQQTVYDLNDFGLSNFDSAVPVAGTDSTASTEADAGADTEQQLPPQPTMVVSLGSGEFFAVDLTSADTDKDGKLTVTEIARAINAVSGGKVTGAVMTVNGQQKLMLSSSGVGEANSFQVHMVPNTSAATSEVTNEAGETVVQSTPAQNAYEVLQAYLAGGASSTAADSTSKLLSFLGEKGLSVRTDSPTSTAFGNTQRLAEAVDAEFKIGGANGIAVKQSSNTYSGIEGLTVVFKETTTSGNAAPLTVTVAKNESATKSNMQSFVDAYNSLTKAIDKLTDAGDAENGVAAGALVNDSGIRSLRNQLNNLLRGSVGGVSLTDYGISAQRDGTIKLDSDRFAAKVASNPEAIDTLLGKTSTLEYQRSGVLGNLQSYVESWTKSSGGILQNRQDNLQKQLKQYTAQQTSIDNLYASAYQRYLLQFTNLANLESQMSNTSTLLKSLFSSSNSSSSS